MKGIIYSKTIVEQGTYLNNVSMYGFDAVQRILQYLQYL